MQVHNAFVDLSPGIETELYDMLTVCFKLYSGASKSLGKISLMRTELDICEKNFLKQIVICRKCSNETFS